MHFKRLYFSTVIFLTIVVSLVFSSNSYGRSLYAITTCGGIPYSTLTAYNIAGEQIEYLNDAQIDNYAVGLALDPDSETLFATYDEVDKIVLINTITMHQIKPIPLSYELAGIVYDQSRKPLNKT